MTIKGELYKCLKCGLLNYAKIRDTPARGTYQIIRCDGCGQRGTSWDKDCYWNRRDYEMPGFIPATDREER